MMSFAAILTAVAFTLSTLGTDMHYPVYLSAKRSLAKPRVPQMGSMAMPLVAPLFIEEIGRAHV